jgi:hypothetical protein
MHVGRCRSRHGDTMHTLEQRHLSLHAHGAPVPTRRTVHAPRSTIASSEFLACLPEFHHDRNPPPLALSCQHLRAFRRAHTACGRDHHKLAPAGDPATHDTQTRRQGARGGAGRGQTPCPRWCPGRARVGRQGRASGQPRRRRHQLPVRPRIRRRYPRGTSGREPGTDGRGLRCTARAGGSACPCRRQANPLTRQRHARRTPYIGRRCAGCGKCGALARGATWSCAVCTRQAVCRGAGTMWSRPLKQRPSYSRRHESAMQ